jgi:hypothetical protein
MYEERALAAAISRLMPIGALCGVLEESVTRTAETMERTEDPPDPVLVVPDTSARPYLFSGRPLGIPQEPLNPLGQSPLFGPGSLFSRGKL